MFIESRSSSSSGTQTEAFQVISSEGGIHRTYLELAFLCFRVCLYIAAEENGNGFLRVIEKGDRTQFGHHLFQWLGVLPFCFLRAFFVPKTGRSVIGFFQCDDGLALGKGTEMVSAFRFFERVVGIFVQTSGIHSFGVFLQLEVYGDVVLRDETGIVFCP